MLRIDFPPLFSVIHPRWVVYEEQNNFRRIFIVDFSYCNIFKENWLLPISLFMIYSILRIACAVVSVEQSAKEN